METEYKLKSMLKMKITYTARAVKKTINPFMSTKSTDLLLFFFVSF